MTPADLVGELRTWTHAAAARPASDVMDDAATEIEQLRNERDDAVATMNVCIREYQNLIKVALDGDLLLAYRLGVRHAKDGDPAPQLRTGRIIDGSLHAATEQDPGAGGAA